MATELDRGIQERKPDRGVALGRRRLGSLLLALPVGCLIAGAGQVMPNRALAQSAEAQPVAIVEDVTSEMPGVRAFDYLAKGRLISLSVGETLILGYLRSCVRETIQGGEVSIGARESVVVGGLVIREIVECDGGRTELSAAEAAQSGVITFRAGAQDRRGTASNPIRVFSSSPAFTFPRSVSAISIRRLDGSEPALTLPVAGRTLDLRATGEVLTPGVVYEARAGGAVRVFEIAASARPAAPLTSRLVRF